MRTKGNPKTAAVKRFRDRPKSLLPRVGLTRVDIATRRVAQFAAAPLRRTAIALRPPSANSIRFIASSAGCRPKAIPPEIPIPVRRLPSGRSRSGSAEIIINHHSAKRSAGTYIAKIILRTTSARTPTDRCASCAICGRRRSRGKHTGSRSNRDTSCSRGWPDRGNRCCRTRSSRA